MEGGRIERRRTDREEKISPLDIMCRPHYYDYYSPFVFKALAFTVDRKIESLNFLTESIISSTEDSPEQLDYLQQLCNLTLQDPRLGDYLDSKLVSHLLRFLRDEKSVRFQYFSAAVLRNIVSSEKGSEFKDESIPYLLNLIPSPDLHAKTQAVGTLTEIAKVFPETCETMINNGALELLESLFTNKSNNEVFLVSGSNLLTALCRMEPRLPSHKMIKVVRTISTAIEYDSDRLLVQVCLALSILSDQRLVEIGTEVTRLLDLIDHPIYRVVISALRTIGNYVRWGDDEEIQFMIEQSLLLRLGKMLCHKYTIVRKEACWIISNITAAANNSQIQEVIDLRLIETLVRLVRVDEFEVKEVAACAISNVVCGSDKKQFTYLKKEFFPLLDEVRFVFCRDDPRVVTLCSKILQLDNIAYRTEASSEIFEPVSLPTKKEERSSIRVCMTNGTTADPTSALYAQQSKKITRKKKSSVTREKKSRRR